MMRLVAVLVCLTQLLAASPVQADDQQTHWVEEFPHFFTAKGQIWHSPFEEIRFDAVKIHLGYYNLSLVDIADFSVRNRTLINNVNDNRKFSSTLLDIGVENLLRSYPDSAAVATVSAGWSSTLKKVEQVGLLRIDGVEHDETSDNPAMSAIVCLNSPGFETKGYDYQIPTFYRLDVAWQFSFIEKCRNALQVGPRIIEDIAQGGPTKGIEDAELNLRPQIRTIMVIDSPSRNTLRNFKARDNARNAYFIVTRNAVHLLSLQSMLLSSGFYGDKADPEWAVNLVNGGPSGIALRSLDQNSLTTFGNPSGIFGSAIVVTRRY